MTLEDKMREWLLECFASDDDQEEIESLGFNGLFIAVNRYYDGGIAQFIMDGE